MKDEVEDMFLFLAWLDPFYKPRKTSSDLITVDSGNEASEDKFITKTLITNLTQLKHQSVMQTVSHLIISDQQERLNYRLKRI